MILVTCIFRMVSKYMKVEPGSELNLDRVSPHHEWRESVKLVVAAFLAVGCWSLLGWLLFAQFQYSLTVSAKLENPENKDRVVLIKDARDGVNQTSSSIYALLTPIAASITGYFFVSSGSGKVSDKKSIQNILPAIKDETPLIKPSS
jgi:hypothetical protein